LHAVAVTVNRTNKLSAIVQSWGITQCPIDGCL